MGWKHGCDFKQMKLFRGADRGVFFKVKGVDDNRCEAGDHAVQ